MGKRGGVRKRGKKGEDAGILTRREGGQGKQKMEKEDGGSIRRGGKRK